MPIEVTFLRDRENGGQEAQPSNLANELAKFINAAKSSLHIAIYDFRLTDKVAVCDDAVVTGSFNFSHSATQNAENTLVLHDKKLADEYSDYIDKLIAQYGNS